MAEDVLTSTVLQPSFLTTVLLTGTGPTSADLQTGSVVLTSTVLLTTGTTSSTLDVPTGPPPPTGIMQAEDGVNMQSEDGVDMNEES